MNESLYNKLFAALPLSLKRRITKEDFNWIDKKINNLNAVTSWYRNNSSFDVFTSDVISDIINEFVMEVKGDDIKVIPDDEYGEMFDDDDLERHFVLYWDIIPILRMLYKNVLLTKWNK
jgi:hypothetical protein